MPSLFGKSRGFSLAELLVAVVISAIAAELLATFQTNIAQYAVRLRQKVEVLDFEQDLIRTLYESDSCTCLTKGLSLTPDGTSMTGGARFAVSVPSVSVRTTQDPRYDATGALNCSPTPGRVLATSNEALPSSQNRVSAGPIRIVNLVRSNNPAVEGEEYLGSFEVPFTTTNGHQINPARAPGRFYVKANQIIGCGPPPGAIVLGTPGAPINNDRQGTAESVATCPAGTKMISGGWAAQYYPLPVRHDEDDDVDKVLGCMRSHDDYPKSASAYFARVTKAQIDSDGKFHLSAQCHTVVALALCFKPNYVP